MMDAITNAQIALLIAVPVVLNAGAAIVICAAINGTVNRQFAAVRAEMQTRFDALPRGAE